jgi:hypothetical protein
MKCKKDEGVWWLLVRLFYQATYYWEWLGFVIWRLYCRATSGVRLPCSAALYTSTTTSVVVYPPLNLTEDLTDKMLVHVNKNNIIGFIFEHSFQWYNFRWHASSFIVLYIMLVQFLVVLIYSSKVPVRCTEEWNALIGELFILTKDVGVISCVTGIDRFLRILFHL